MIDLSARPLPRGRLKVGSLPSGLNQVLKVHFIKTFLLKTCMLDRSRLGLLGSQVSSARAWAVPGAAPAGRQARSSVLQAWGRCRACACLLFPQPCGSSWLSLAEANMEEDRVNDGASTRQRKPEGAQEQDRGSLSLPECPLQPGHLLGGTGQAGAEDPPAVTLAAAVTTSPAPPCTTTCLGLAVLGH